MNATAPTLDLFSLPATEMLDCEQVGSLGIFGAKATLEHNRCLGKPGPRFIKVGARVFYRVSDLLAYLAVQEAASEREQQERRDRFARNAHRLADSPRTSGKHPPSQTARMRVSYRPSPNRPLRSAEVDAPPAEPLDRLPCTPFRKGSPMTRDPDYLTAKNPATDNEGLEPVSLF